MGREKNAIENVEFGSYKALGKFDLVITLMPGSTVVRIGGKLLLVKGTYMLNRERSSHKVIDNHNSKVI